MGKTGSAHKHIEENTKVAKQGYKTKKSKVKIRKIRFQNKKLKATAPRKVEK